MTQAADQLRRLADARMSEGRFAEAAGLLREAVSAAPDEPLGWAALSGCLLLDRRPEAALAACDAGLKRLPQSASLIVARAQALQGLGRLGEAAAAFREALARDPADRPARVGLALLAVEAGRWDEAEGAIRPMLAPGPRLPAVDWIVARIALGRGDQAGALAAGRRVLAGGGLSAPQVAETELLVGEALDALGRPSEAFEAARRGKAALRTLYAERASGREPELERLVRLERWLHAVSAAAWRRAPAGAPDPERPGHVFLLGFPRSGTTLLEQALAGHPALASLEEAPTLAEPAAALLGDEGGARRLAGLSDDEATRWRSAYWREVDALAPDAKGRVFLDKAPAGTPYLPLIARLFPEAKILFALRDPRDVVLSCFRNSFQMNALTYAFTDLTETARCYAATMALAQTCRRLLPLDLVEVRYERLVSDFEAELGRIASFIGLDLAPSMLDVAATASRRVIRTPSAPQVRAGLDRRGLGRWRAYAGELAPVMPILAPWIEALGYGADG